MYAAPPASPSTAADELDDLKMRALRERRGRPIWRLNDAAIQFYSHTRRIEIERLKQLQNGVPVRHRTALAVDRDLDGSVG